MLLPPGGDYPSGWVEVDIELRAGIPRLASGLQVNGGEGVNGWKAMSLPEPKDGHIVALLRLPDAVAGLRFKPLSGPAPFQLGRLRMREVGTAFVAWKVARPIAVKLANDRGRLAAAARDGLALLRKEGVDGVRREFAKRAQRRGPSISYQEWVLRYDTLGNEGRTALAARLSLLRDRPLFSLLMPTYETNAAWLRRAIESVRDQVYPDWELCIADDASQVSASKKDLAGRCEGRSADQVGLPRSQRTHLRRLEQARSSSRGETSSSSSITTTSYRRTRSSGWPRS